MDASASQRPFSAGETQDDTHGPYTPLQNRHLCVFGWSAGLGRESCEDPYCLSCNLRRDPAVRLSLSVRVAEAPDTKEAALLPFDELVRMAAMTGYHAVCMRASQASIHTPREKRRAMRQLLDRLGLAVSMVTGDVDIAWNNDRAALALRQIEPYLDLAEDFGTDLMRVGMKSEEDILWAQRACDAARERGIRLAHQSHVETLFETVEGSLEVLKRVSRDNFGIIYEPANLHICGQDYGPDTIRRFAPWLVNVYLQNLRVTLGAAMKVRTWIRGDVPVVPLPFGVSGSLDLPRVFEGLADIGYRGYVTVHHNVAVNMPPAEGAKQFYKYLTSIAKFDERGN